MTKRFLTAVFLAGVCGLASATAMAEQKKAEDRNAIAIRDDCDPNDPAWAPTGGCTLKGGVVTFAEFGQFLFSPLSAGSPVGHPAWRMEPTYVRANPDETLNVANIGGRTHTFTQVAEYGGGFIPALNGTLIEAPECAANPTPLTPGTKFQIKGLSVGNHRYQCCIHPWMRILIKVEAKGEEDHAHE